MDESVGGETAHRGTNNCALTAQSENCAPKLQCVFGGYTMIEQIYGFKLIWNHNPKLRMTRAEQLQHNKNTIKGFKEVIQ